MNAAIHILSGIAIFAILWIATGGLNASDS
jgi:hypothetical protein